MTRASALSGVLSGHGGFRRVTLLGPVALSVIRGEVAH
jgi:hypothetical protein